MANTSIPLSVRTVDFQSPLSNLIALQDRKREIGRQEQADQRANALFEQQQTVNNQNIRLNDQQIASNQQAADAFVNSQATQKYTESVLTLANLLEAGMQSQDPATLEGAMLQFRAMDEEFRGTGYDGDFAEYAQNMQRGNYEAVLNGLNSQIAMLERLGKLAKGQEGTYSNSPVWGKDADGNYVVMQTNNQGGLSIAPTPEGVSLLPTPGLAGFDANLIGQRAGAETQAEVQNIQQTAGPRAQAAAQETAATGQAQTTVELDRNQQLYEQERAQELQVAQREAYNRLSTQELQVQNVRDTADKVLDQAGFWTTGFFGTMGNLLPGTPQRDLAENLKTLEANAAFDKLQAMRDMSPTGGALGQVSERELDLLRASWSALSQSQSQDQFKENVQKFRDQIQSSWTNVLNAYERDFGQSYFQTEPETGSNGNVIEVDW